MQIIKMTFANCEAMAETGSVRIELRTVIDLGNPLALLQSGGATTAGFFLRHVLDGKSEQEVQQVIATISKAFANHTFDVKRITVPVSYLSDGKGNAVQVTRADGTTQVLQSLVFNSVQESDTDESMMAAAKVSFSNALLSGRYVLTTTQAQPQQAETPKQQGVNNPTSAMQGDFSF